eukprot:Nk52_evm33s207 gene=Nk52_evmTU33s207
MVSAWYMDESVEDQRLPHKCEPNVPVSLEELRALGCEAFVVKVEEDESHMNEIEKICKERNYSNRDVVSISKDTPNIDGALVKFFTEHIHEDEEIRYILDGSGYFDVRSADDKWIRIFVETGDLLIVPSGIYHRFTLDESMKVKAMRLFKDVPLWTPINRPEADQNLHRIEYVNSLKAAQSIGGN